MAAPDPADSDPDGVGDAVQRRRAFRVDLIDSATVRMPGRHLLDVQLVDVSGTGFEFHTREQFSVDERGHVTLPFGAPPPDLPFVVRVLRTDGHRNFVGCEFVDLTPAAEDAIVREVFAEQRRQLRNLRGGGRATADD